MLEGGDYWMNWMTDSSSELEKPLPVAADPGLQGVERWLKAEEHLFPLPGGPGWVPSTTYMTKSNHL